MNHIDAWWFNDYQEESAIVQPDFFRPKTHFGILGDIEGVHAPFEIQVTAVDDCDVIIYHETFLITESIKNESIEIEFHEKGFLFKSTADTLPKQPGRLKVNYSDKHRNYAEIIECNYSTLSGTIKDFKNKPFRAAFLLYRVAFDGNSSCMGVWSDESGGFSITVPNGRYNAFYLDDDTYGKTSLECWGWHMIVDRNEEYNFKIGNGEVYSLTAWVSNGGFSTLFIYFRPMILNPLKNTDYTLSINNKTFSVKDISPDLQIEDINVLINNFKAEPISLQKIYETSAGGDAMPAYVLQVRKWIPGNSMSEKQTLILEYDTSKRKQADDNAVLAQSQGTLQFFYKDSCANYIE